MSVVEVVGFPLVFYAGWRAASWWWMFVMSEMIVDMVEAGHLRRESVEDPSWIVRHRRRKRELRRRSYPTRGDS